MKERKRREEGGRYRVKERTNKRENKGEGCER